ncbi:unnamed protein product [Bursaphelenchus xylophilus]|uniref:Glycosyltransferase family 92 protein n=1 Tax=Bursaphelenchus xylophilus TaxID=6326 RepID=A0A1I7SCU3_BURXY|nr:unnamed protein product [Bursaphelenchus xylophilus]CAG9093474.1 unnamed protein product [Bursaphelenchus xylophilus]
MSEAWKSHKNKRLFVGLGVTATIALFVTSQLLINDNVPLNWIHNRIKDVVQKDEPIDMFVATAHAANFEHSPHLHTVYLNTMVGDTANSEEKRRDRMKFKCISDGDEVVDSLLHGIDGGGGCSWKNYYFVCQFQRPVQSVRLVDDSGFGPELAVKQPISGKIPLVVCLSRTFYYENWQVMLTVLEMYKAMGVSEFSIHIINIVKEVYDILKLYQNEINLKIHPGYLTPKILGRPENPNFETEAINQIVAYNDCFYSYREAAEFLIFSDLDDLITPENGDLLAKAQQLLQQFPTASSFEFPWTISKFGGAQNPSAFSIPRLFSGLEVLHIENYGKSIIVPKRICNAIIHNAVGESARVKGYEHKNVSFTEGHGRTLHIREMVMKDFNGSVADDKSVDKVDRKFVNIEAMERAERALRQRIDGKLNKAFQTLPSNLFFTPLFRNCYKDMILDKRQCSSLSFCKITTENRPQCAAVASDYKGYINGKLNFYVQHNLRIVEDSNCELQLANPVIIERR